MAKPTLQFDFSPRGSVLADVTVESGPWTLKGFKVMKPTPKSKSKTIWVSWPSVKIGRWTQLVSIEDDDKAKQLEGLIIAEYTTLAVKRMKPVTEESPF